MKRLPMMILVGLWLTASGCVSRAPVSASSPLQLQPFGSVWIDATGRALVVSGFVNQVEGAIELVACGPGGKTHESIFVLKAEAQDIQAALLLMGLKHGEPMGGLGQGPPAGDEVSIEIEWEQKGRIRRAPAEYFILDYATRRPVRHEGWVFNGSKIENNYFLARAEESFIATYWDPWAIVNLKSAIGSDDERLAVHRDRVPPLHQPVRMVIRPVNAP